MNLHSHALLETENYKKSNMDSKEYLCLPGISSSETASQNDGFHQQNRQAVLERWYPFGALSLFEPPLSLQEIWKTPRLASFAAIAHQQNGHLQVTWPFPNHIGWNRSRVFIFLTSSLLGISSISIPSKTSHLQHAEARNSEEPWWIFHHVTEIIGSHGLLA